MIVPMKEVTIVAARRAQAETLDHLQDAGVVHIAERTLGDDAVAEDLRARIRAARHAIDVLAHVAPQGAVPEEAAGPSGPGAHAPEPLDAASVIAEVERLAEQLDDLRSTRDELERERERLAPFGDFDPEALRGLRGRGVGVRLAHPSAGRELPDVPRAVWIELGAARRRRDARRPRTVALVGPVDAVDAADVPDEVAWPSEPPARLEHETLEVARGLERTRARLAALVGEREHVQAWLDRTQEALHAEQVRAGMARVGAVVVLRGFVPFDEVEHVRALAHRHGWGLWVEDVRDADEAPTLVRNPRWVRPIEPLFGFLGVVPAYGHVDISLPFLVFFGLFFAMIVGDAGYGLLFLALTEWWARRVPRKGSPPSRRVVALMRLLSAATIVWGLLSGNVFGIAVLPSMLAWFQLDWLTVERNVIGLTFAIGAAHLTLAHLWNAVRYANTLRALAELGWIATTWTMYFLARQLVLDDPFPAVAWPVFGVGVALIFAFTTPWKRLRREWFGHAVLPLSLVNNFVDVVSYVRLFAVGAATFAVAGAFNDLAAGIGLGGPVGGVLAALVLFFGHALNVLLAAMGVLVHGVRLNTLEFAGHLGLPWTGHAYRPLAHTAPVGAEGDR
ncbi:MAG: V-type ATP synthase subunit I [Trueperaceae bacterium]